MQIILGALADDLAVQFEKAGVQYIGKPPPPGYYPEKRRRNILALYSWVSVRIRSAKSAAKAYEGNQGKGGVR